MSKFKVGDNVWLAKCNWESIKTVCPTCFGKNQVTLILGNGDKVLLECSGCDWGYEGPHGYILEYDYVTDPEEMCISGMEISIDGSESKTRYICNRGFIHTEDDIFLTREEANIASKKKKEILDQEQITRSEYIKKDKQKSFAWNANYHQREYKRNIKQAEYHSRMAKICNGREQMTEEEEEDALLLRKAGCKCDLPLLGYIPGKGPRCRMCGVEVILSSSG